MHTRRKTSWTGGGGGGEKQKKKKKKKKLGAHSAFLRVDRRTNIYKDKKRPD